MKRRAGELGVRLVDEHDALRRHARARSSRIASSGIGTPVGLFGFVRKTTRVSRRDRREHLVERKREVGSRHHLHEPAADDLGVEREDLERRLRNDRLRDRGRPAAAADSATASAMMPSSRPLVERQPVGIDAEIAARTRRVAAAYGG